MFRMTHHEKLVERYEDALFALMMEDVAETEGEKLQELNEQLKCDPAAEIPEELDERCIRTIRTEFGKKNFKSARRGAVRVFRVISAATLIMMLLFTTAFAASPSFRTQTLTALVEMFDDHSEIRFSGTTNGAETHKMSILWMPDGYQIGLEEFELDKLLNGTLCLSPEIASSLERFLGIPASFWLSLQSAYEEDLDKSDDNKGIVRTFLNFVAPK